MGLSQTKMAACLGMAQGTYKQYETRTRPIRELVAQIATRLHIPALAYLDDQAVSDAAFGDMLNELGQNKTRIRRFVNDKVTIPSDDNPVIASVIRAEEAAEEGKLGSETLDHILKCLRLMDDKIERNTSAIADIRETVKPGKPGFTKGRN